MASALDIFEPTFRKFEKRAHLDASDREAFFALPFEVRVFEQHQYISREGDRAPGASLILNGLAYRHKMTVQGARQILSLHVPGDFVDLEGSLLTVADHNVQALTQCECAVVPRAAIVDLIQTRARLAYAMWIDTLVDASVYREWLLNVGQRATYAAMCHLLCEVTRRLEVAGIAQRHGYELPMTQEQLADALGVSPVHANRVLRELDAQGLIVRDKRFVRIPNWEALRKAAGFKELYLHLDQVAVDPPVGAKATIELEVHHQGNPLQ